MSKVVDQAPPGPREMVRITIGLTIVCLIAAVILGALYFITAPAKLLNQQLHEQSLIRSLLNLGEKAKIHEVRRYLLSEARDPQIVYLTPRKLVHMDVVGKELGVYALPDEILSSTSYEMKDEWVRKKIAVSDPERLKYVGRFFVGIEEAKPPRYVVEGASAGYKTWIRFFIAIDADYGIQGLEVIHHEEDPGLGAEITQRYFKNQFAGRSFGDIEKISVVKDPLPEGWRMVLEELGDIPFDPWVGKYGEMLPKNPNIHAITGATISSAAVTNGVKRALGNFRKRMTLVEKHL